MTRINGIISSFQRLNHIELLNCRNIIYSIGRPRSDSLPIVCTSVSRCDEYDYGYAVPASNSKDDSESLSYQETLIHEHSYVPATDRQRKCIVICITCGIYFCELCGKALDDPLNHFD
jgi:hypothetical protein